MRRSTFGPWWAGLAALLGLIGGDRPADVREGQTSPLSNSEERVKAFMWFGTLGYPDLKDRKPVRVATGEWVRWSETYAPENSYLDGFLLEEKGDTFTVLTRDLVTRAFTKTPPDAPPHERVGYEEHSLGEEVATVLDPAARGSARPTYPYERLRRYSERTSVRAEVFVLAWACWRNGLETEAAALYDITARLPDRRGTDDRSKRTFQQAVESDISTPEMWRAVAAFGDPDVSRTQLLERFEAIVHRFPHGEHAARARETAELLRQMIREDAEHAERRAGGKPFQELSRADQVAELIYQLRDQNCRQPGPRGNCSVFRTRDNKEDSPAHYLHAIGYEALPRLIEALGDRRFTRSVHFEIDATFSHEVMRVGDCADQLIRAITGPLLYERPYADVAAVKDDEAPLLKQEIRTWYERVGKKGQKQILVEAVERGGRTSPELALWLVEEYPGAAQKALQAAIKAAGERERVELVKLASRLEGDNDSVGLLLNDVERGPFRGSRVMAAAALCRRERPEGVAAMLAEWNRARPWRPEDGSAPPSATEDLDLVTVVHHLASCGKVEAIQALGKDLPLRPVDLRWEAVSACGRAGEHVFPAAAANLPPEDPTRRDHPRALRWAIEALLVAALDDTEERTGLWGSFDGKRHYSDPRVCDMAGGFLNRLAPEDYAFDVSAPRDERDRALVELKNVWRRRQGLEPLPLPAPRTFAPVPEEKLSPLLDQFLRGPMSARRVTELAVEQYGHGALPALLKRLKAVQGKDDPGAAALRRLAARLACVVTEVVVAERSLPPDDELAAALGAMKGRPLEPEEFIDTLVGLVLRSPRDVHAIRLAADRDGDTGIRITVDLLDAVRAGRQVPGFRPCGTPTDTKQRPGSWRCLKRVTADGRSAWELLSGGRAVGEWTAKGAADLTDALSRACTADPDQPIEIRLHMAADWGNSERTPSLKQTLSP